MLRALTDPHWSALSPQGPLRRWQLIEVTPGSTLVGSPLRIDEQLHFDVDLPAERHLGGTARVLRQDGHNVYALRFEDCPPGTLADLRAFVEATAGATLH